MNVYDTANKLAQELKTSTEYLDYKKIKEELDRSPDVKAKIREFEEKRYEVQLEALKGEEQEKTKLEEMQKIYIELMQNELAKTYFEIELKFNVLIADVNKIIAESVQDVIK
ncbi:MAG: YlbF family regulator [Clostridia bacterium]|nr:YlbF family regulator [Clostridia bacterium]